MEIPEINLIPEKRSFEDHFQPEYLATIFDENHKGKPDKGIDHISPLQFEKIKESEFQLISRKVLDGTYRFSPYVEKLILRNRWKTPRVLSLPTVRDRIVLSALKDFLHLEYPDNVPRKIANTLVKDIKDYLVQNANTRNLYYLRTDIKSFYDSIPHAILIGKLSDLDPLPLHLVKDAIENPTVPRNTSKDQLDKYKPEKGVPQGLSISNILAQLFLYEIDEKYENIDLQYFRYVDDILLVDTKRGLVKKRGELARDLADLGLRIHAKEKTAHGKMDGDGFTFLGYLLVQDGITIPKANIQRHIRKIAGKFKWAKKGLQNEVFRPKWLQDDPNRFFEVFKEELNEAITGMRSQNKNYGWVFYYREIEKIDVLYKVDHIVGKLFRQFLNIEPPSTIKRHVRAYHEIKFKNGGKYVGDYDLHDTPKKMRDFLVLRGELDPDQKYSDDEIDKFYTAYRNRKISAFLPGQSHLN